LVIWKLRQPSLLSSGAKTLWQLDDTDLTGQLFREGVDKIVAASGSSSGSGGGATTNIEEISGITLTERIADSTARSELSSHLSASNSEMTTNFDAAVQRMYSTPTATGSGSGSESIWTLQLPLGFGTFQDIDLNPMHVTGMTEIALWVKTVISIMAIWLFESWCWTQFQTFTIASQQLQQTKGNTVAMGTGAQATNLLSATLVAVVMVSLPALFVAAFTAAVTALGYSGGFELMPSGPEYFQAAFWVLTQFVPVTLILLILAQVFVVRKAGLLVYNLAGIAVKYIVF